MAVVQFEQRGPVAWVTLNRPERRNTLIAESFDLLAAAWDRISTDETIRVAVLTATGTQDFCCGGDIGAFISPLRESVSDDGVGVASTRVSRALLLDSPLPKPLISAINGTALGGGTELIQATDIRIASSTASFGLPEPRIGIVPGAGSLVRLARQVPYAHAMHLLLTGDSVDAATALRWGLVSEVVPPEDLIRRVTSVAERVAANAPLALRRIKEVVHETHNMDWARAHAFEQEITNAVLATADAREGTSAFLEKRQPKFDGR
jgi:enoyl-CoA hydratase